MVHPVVDPPRRFWSPPAESLVMTTGVPDARV
jgi:hypothetical protein